MLRPNLMLAGNAEEALHFYAAALGGEIEIARFAGSPAEPHVPKDYAGKVLYGTLRSPFGQVNVMDAPPANQGKPGDNFAIAIDVAEETRAGEIFEHLVDGGTVLMPLEQTFFARKFGMLTDRFGIKWMVHVEPAAVPA